MKVRCKKIISMVTRKELNNISPWFTIGKEYVVLALKANPKEAIDILIQSDHDGAPVFADISGFEVISQSISKSWEIEDYKGTIYMMPKSWMEESFLNDLDEDEPYAVKLFEKEAAIMYAEEGFVLQNTH